MSEQILLCHGAPIADSHFDLPGQFSIFYIGVPGTPLLVKDAEKILAALKSDPTDIEGAARRLGLVVESIEGPQTTGPNFELQGDSDLPTQLYDLIGRTTTELGDDWRTRLGTLVSTIAQQGGAHNLYLLCCWES